MTDPKKLALVTALATAIAVPAEGLRQYAYRDPVGIPTICFGATHGVKLGDVATVEQCRTMLNRDMLNAIQAVDACRPGLPPAVLAAFAAAAYNLGPVIACDAGRSTASRYLASANYKSACDELPKWDKARVAGVMVALPGLTKRRAAERDLCLQGA